MKKFYSFLFAAVALVGFAACNSDSTEEPAPEQVKKMEFTANIGEDTKTQLTEGAKVKWCAEDAIAVSNGTNVEEFTIKSLSEDGKTAVFEGNVHGGDVFYAIYPYAEGAKYENGAWTGVAEPTEQTAVAGSFADGAAVSVGTYNGDGSFSFTNESAILKFQVPTFAEGIHKVEFMDQNNENARLVLIEKGDVNLTDGNVYYAVVSPGSYKLLVRINGYLSKESSKTLDCVKNTIYNLGTLPAPEKASWNIRGSIAASNWGTDLPLYKYDNNGNQVITNLNFGDNGAFKFYNSTNSWSGYTEGNWADESNGWMWISDGGGSNIPVSGTVDIYVNDSGWAYKIVPTGEYPF